MNNINSFLTTIAIVFGILAVYATGRFVYYRFWCRKTGNGVSK